MTESLGHAARLGPLSPTQIQAALDRFDLGRFLAASPVPMGHGGQNVFVESTAGHFVLRGNPLFQGQLAKERFFARLLHRRVPFAVPWPYCHDTGTDIFGWSYALMPRLTGIDVIAPAAETTLTSGDRPGITMALADALAALHGVSWPHPGQYAPDTDTIKPLPVPFAEWVAEQLWDKVRKAEAAVEPLLAADIAWVQSLSG